MIQQSRVIPPTFGRYLASNLFCEMPPWCVGRSRLVKIETLAMFYTEAYMRGKVSLVFYKSMMAEKDLFKHTIGSETRIQDQLQPWANLVPVDLSELRDTLKILEADTFDELKIKLKRRKRPLEAFVRK